MIIVDVQQGTPEWLAARAGSLGASQVSLALAKIKSGYGASRANVRAQLIAERLTGAPCETFQTAEMKYGQETEAEARAAYEFHFDCAVTLVGLVKHPKLPGTHASPDGLLGEDGLVEFKCPNTATHIETLLSGEFDGKYLTQVQWQMAVTGRKWGDLVSYDKRMPAHMRLVVKRIERDEVRIAELEREVTLFLAEVSTMQRELSAKYPALEVAA